jgi:hypothetical protein
MSLPLLLTTATWHVCPSGLVQLGDWLSANAPFVCHFSLCAVAARQQPQGPLSLSTYQLVSQ